MIACLRTPQAVQRVRLTSLETFSASPAGARDARAPRADPARSATRLTTSYDRPAFHAPLDARSSCPWPPRADGASSIDGDRLTTIKARIGHLAADAYLDRREGDERRGGPRDLPSGSAAALRSRALAGSSRDAEEVFERLKAALQDHPLPKLGVVSSMAASQSCFRRTTRPRLVRRWASDRKRSGATGLTGRQADEPRRSVN